MVPLKWVGSSYNKGDAGWKLQRSQTGLLLLLLLIFYFSFQTFGNCFKLQLYFKQELIWSKTAVWGKSPRRKHAGVPFEWKIV